MVRISGNAQDLVRFIVDAGSYATASPAAKAHRVRQALLGVGSHGTGFQVDL